MSWSLRQIGIPPANCHSDEWGHFEDTRDRQGILETPAWMKKFPTIDQQFIDATSPEKLKNRNTDGAI